MPPTSGSTSRSTTRRPSFLATSGPIARSPSGPRRSGRGATTSTSSRTLPRRPRMPDRATGKNRVGTPSSCPAGNGRRRPPDQTAAPAAPIGSSSAPSPSSRHSATASGRRPRNPSGPTSTGRPSNVSVFSLPPTRGVASSTTTVGVPGAGPSRPPVSSHAAASPAMPAPTTAIVRGRERRPLATPPAGPVGAAEPAAAFGPAAASAPLGGAISPASSTTRARTSRKRASSFSDAVRTNATPAAAATARASTSRS